MRGGRPEGAPGSAARALPQQGGQSRTWSAIESGATMFVGYLCAVLFYQIVWPLFGYEVQLADSAAVALLMFPVNYVRQYGVRRAFNWMQQRGNGNARRDGELPPDASSPYE